MSKMAPVEEIREALAPVQQQAQRLQGNLELSVLQIAPALLTPEGTHLEHALKGHASHAEPTAAPFATDGGNLHRLNIDSIVFGPGSIDVAHRADEFIPAKDLLTCVDTIEQVVRQRCLSITDQA